MAGVINLPGGHVPKGAQVMAIPIKPGTTTTYIVTKNPQTGASSVKKGDVTQGQQILTVVPQQQMISTVTTSGSSRIMTPSVSSLAQATFVQASPASLRTPSPWTGLGNGTRGLKRTSDMFDDDPSDIYGRRLSAKKDVGKAGGKGLRHFSMKVCEKVQRKGKTTYNEVADELVSEFASSDVTSPTDQNYDQKNIRRRVYDALNVLMAMNIIAKEKKEILWLGLPTNSAQECEKLEAEKMRRIERIRKKTQQLNELILQQVAFKALVERNKKRDAEGHPRPKENFAIKLPFIIINTNKKTVIDCSISSDKSEYLFDFNNMFEIHDDIECLKRMGMDLGLEKGHCRPEDLKRALSMVPDAFQKYVLEMADGRDLSTWVPPLPNYSQLVMEGRNQEDLEVAAAMIGHSQGSSQGSSQGGMSSAMSSQSSTTRGSTSDQDDDLVDMDDYSNSSPPTVN